MKDLESDDDEDYEEYASEKIIKGKEVFHVDGYLDEENMFEFLGNYVSEKV